MNQYPEDYENRPVVYAAPEALPASEPNRKKEKRTALTVLIVLNVLLLLLSAVTVGVCLTMRSGGNVPPEEEPKEETVPPRQPETDPGTAAAEKAPETAPNGEETILPEFRKVTEEGMKTVSEVYADNVNAVVGITAKGTSVNIFGQKTTTASTGTGFIVNEKGYILTNCHVIESGSDFMVTLYDGSIYEAAVIGADAETDIAVLKIDADGLQTVELGDSDGNIVGEEIAVIGNPLGELTYTMTKGIVSALNRVIDTGDGAIRMFQIDAAVNAGNSGGPAFNACGQVIGIVTAKYSSDTVEGIGFCIPIRDAVRTANDLISYGFVRGRASIGAEYTDAYSVYAYYRLYGRGGRYLSYGAYVTKVNPGSAAEKAGLEADDTIIAIDGTKLNDDAALDKALRHYSPGDTAELTVYRNGNEMKITVTLDEYIPSGAVLKKEGDVVL